MSNVEEKTRPEAEELELEVQGAAEEKVALDLEGADFLEDDEPEQEENVPAVPEGEDEEGAEEEKPKSKRKLIIIGAAVLVLLLGGGALWWFVLRTPPPPPPPPVEPEIVRVPKAPTTPPKPNDYIISFEPFWVPLPDGKGGTVFLVSKFALVTKSEKLQLEVQNKMILLRDAVYYYLVNKPYHFLIDHANVNTIKKDLASVFSGYLVSGKVDDMLFESYIGK